MEEGMEIMFAFIFAIVSSFFILYLYLKDYEREVDKYKESKDRFIKH